MIIYADGTIAQIGDHVDFDGIVAVVEHVIDTVEEQESWGVSDRGLMFNTKEMGWVFEPVDTSCWDSIIFLSRAKIAS